MIIIENRNKINETRLGFKKKFNKMDNPLPKLRKKER